MQKRANHQKLPIVYQPILFSDHAICNPDLSPVELPDQAIPVLHYHNCLELGICLSGSGMFLFGNRPESIAAGDALLIPPNLHHYSRSISREPCRCQFVYILPQAFDTHLQLNGISFSDRLRSQTEPYLFKREEDRETIALIQRICNAAAAQNDALCLLCAAELLLSLPTPSRSMPQPLPADDLIAYVMESITLHYREPLSNSMLAESVHLSESQLRRRFTAVYGQPPHTYLNAFRCRIGAKILCYTDRSVEETAEAVGFASVSDFYRHFRKEYGTSPTAFRKRNRTRKNDCRTG